MPDRFDRMGAYTVQRLSGGAQRQEGLTRLTRLGSAGGRKPGRISFTPKLAGGLREQQFTNEAVKLGSHFGDRRWCLALMHYLTPQSIAV
jgi:hypothetical protein